jgi:hypothetical protein
MEDCNPVLERGPPYRVKGGRELLWKVWVERGGWKVYVDV